MTFFGFSTFQTSTTTITRNYHFDLCFRMGIFSSVKTVKKLPRRTFFRWEGPHTSSGFDIVHSFCVCFFSIKLELKVAAATRAGCAKTQSSDAKPFFKKGFASLHHYSFSLMNRNHVVPHLKIEKTKLLDKGKFWV